MLKNRWEAHEQVHTMKDFEKKKKERDTRPTKRPVSLVPHIIFNKNDSDRDSWANNFSPPFFFFTGKQLY